MVKVEVLAVGMFWGEGVGTGMSSLSLLSSSLVKGAWVPME